MLALLCSQMETVSQVPQLLNYQGRIAVNGTNFTGLGQFKFALISASTNTSVRATAGCTVSFGFLVNIAVSNGGAGYTTPPSVSISDSSGAGASAFSQISGGVVTNIVVTSAGNGYSASPIVTISAPPQQNVAGTFWSNDGSSNAGGQPATAVPLPVAKGLYSVLLGDTTLSNMSGLPPSVFANADVRLRVWFSDGATGFQQMIPDQRLAAVGYAMMAGAVPDASITGSKIATGAIGSTQLAPNLTLTGTLTVSNLVVNGSAMTGPSNYQMPGGTNVQAQAGGYILVTNSTATITLPTSANVGDTIHIRIATGNGNYTVRQSAGQRIESWNTISVPYGPIVCSGDGTRLITGDGASDGILFSTNSATGWSVQTIFGNLPTPRNGIGPLLISADGSHIMMEASFAYYQATLRSSDYGQSWFLNTNLPPPSAFASSTNGNKMVAVVPNGGIYTSSDSGSNWTLRTSAPTNAYWGSVASSADGTKLFVGCLWNGGPMGGVYTSGNSGQTWALQTAAPITNANWLSIAASADGTRLIAAVQTSGAQLTNGLYVSINSGQTWTLKTNMPINVNWYAVACSSDGLKFVATADWSGSDGGVYASTDVGQTWSQKQSGIPAGAVCYYLTSSSDCTKLYGYFGNGTFYSSGDFADTWSPILSFPSAPASTMDAISSPGLSGGATFTSLYSDWEKTRDFGKPSWSRRRTSGLWG